MAQNLINSALKCFVTIKIWLFYFISQPIICPLQACFYWIPTAFHFFLKRFAYILIWNVFMSACWEHPCLSSLWWCSLCLIQLLFIFGALIGSSQSGFSTLHGRSLCIKPIFTFVSSLIFQLSPPPLLLVLSHCLSCQQCVIT